MSRLEVTFLELLLLELPTQVQAQSAYLWAGVVEEAVIMSGASHALATLIAHDALYARQDAVSALSGNDGLEQTTTRVWL